MEPTRNKFTILKQVMSIIPPRLVNKISKDYGVDKQSRSFTPWSHVVSMIYTQLSHSLSLNDTCDALRNHSSELMTIREATPPSRNGLSHANKTRDSGMAETLFWNVYDSLKVQFPKFGSETRQCGLPRRFKRTINLVDSTTISLVANCMDWARHRRKKAAAKCHMRLDLQTFLPSFAIVKAASDHDSVEAKRLCAGIKEGEIVVFDKAYVDYEHLYELDKRGVFWVTRAKENMSCRIMKTFPVSGKIIQDDIIKLTSKKSFDDYPKTFRRVIALVEVDGKEVEMTFISNNTTWAASSICDLYKSRWGIEAFFKQLKQTLQLADFLGHSENAIRWQIWTALLTYLLLRFLSYVTEWQGSFSRLFTTVRGVLWSKLSLYPLMRFCGTAYRRQRMCAVVERLYLPGLSLKH